MSRLSNKLILGCVGALCAALSTASYADSVMTTVKPLAMIIQAVAPKGITVNYLVPGNQCPHEYSMRPSDSRKLKESSHFFWLGKDFEPIMRPEAAIASSSVNLTASFATQPKLTKGGTHIWLNPMTALALATSAAETLTIGYPQKKNEIAQRLTTFKKEITAIDVDLKRHLANSTTKGFVGLHDAYGNLSTEFGLNQLTAFYQVNEQMIGIASRAALKKKLSNTDEVCVFAQPQFQIKPITTLLSGHKLKILNIDPLATGDSGNAGYIEYFKDISKQIKTCF